MRNDSDCYDVYIEHVVIVSCPVVCHVVGITYQHIRKSVLQELLGSVSGLYRCDCDV